MWTVAVFFITLLVLYLWVSRPRRPHNFPPGPPTLLIFGNLITLLKTTSDFLNPLKKLRSEYNSDIIGLVDPFGNKLIHVFGGDLIKKITAMPESAGRPQLFSARYLSEMKTAGIFFNEGPLWQEHRRFALKHLRDLGLGKRLLNTMIADEFSLFAEHLRKRVGQEVKAKNMFITVVLNIIWKMIMNGRFHYNDQKLQRLQDVVTEFTQIIGPQNILSLFPSARFFAPEASGFNQLERVRSEISALFGPYIDEHRKTLDPDNPRDFVDAFLMESQLAGAVHRGFDDNNLQTLCMDFFIAGSETTSTSLTWAMLYLVLYPDIQTKMQSELDEVMGDRLPSYEDRPRLPYTEAVMTEVWRFSSFVPVAVPHAIVGGPIQVAGYTIPQGSTVMLHLHSAHQDQAHWGDPDVFRPERFIGYDGKFRADDFFMQFSHGKRACLGESMARTEFFTFLACLFQQFRLRLPKGAKIPATKTDSFAIFLQPEAFNVILEQRKEG